MSEEYAPTFHAIGLKEVALGFQPPYLVTVYAISGDATSSIVGLLYPNGEFVPKSSSKTIRYRDDDDEVIATPVWSGKAGRIRMRTGRAHRRITDTNALLGEQETSGELWTAIKRGTGMTGRKLGRVHLRHSREFEPLVRKAYQWQRELSVTTGSR